MSWKMRRVRVDEQAFFWKRRGGKSNSKGNAHAQSISVAIVSSTCRETRGRASMHTNRLLDPIVKRQDLVDRRRYSLGLMERLDGFIHAAAGAEDIGVPKRIYWSAIAAPPPRRATSIYSSWPCCIVDIFVEWGMDSQNNEWWRL